jgi:adenylate kinase family enzyme
MNRVVVIGSSCSGKTVFSKQLAFALEAPHIELDELHWLPNWQERDKADFYQLVDQTTLLGSWVVDGNYAVARSIVWSRASTIIWLNHSFSVVLYRSIRRSIFRVINRKALFSGNIETFRRAFFSRKSIILWVLMTYHDKRRRYAEMLEAPKGNRVRVIQFKKQSQVDQYLESL